MSSLNPEGKATSSACSQSSVTVNTSGVEFAKNTGPHKYTAKRTPRSLPGSTAATNFSPLPPVRHILSNSSSTRVAPVVPTESATAAASKPPQFVPYASRARTHHASTRTDLSIHTQVSRNSFQSRQPWCPDGIQSSYQHASQPAGQVSTISTRTRRAPDPPPLGRVRMPNDNLYDFTFSAPIMEQPKSIGRIPIETLPVKASYSPTPTIPRSQPPPISSSRKGNSSYYGPVYIDLTQDGPSLDSEPSAATNGANLAPVQNAEPVQVARANRLGANNKVNPPSPSISDASSDLPSTNHICQIVTRDTPRTPGQKRKRDDRPPDPLNGVQQAAVTSSASASVIQGVVKDTVRPASQVPLQDNITTPAKIAVQMKVKSVQFDSSAFDTALYQQPDAAPPPAGVVIGPRIENKPPLSQTTYIYANPAIHGMHNRSKAWHEKKALEIQSRGGRKFWFSKVSARLRWLQSKRIRSSKTQDVTCDQMPERADPEPGAYRRPLDFGDVPESKLPEKVRQNPDWLKACEWFRQQQNLRDMRLRESKRCEQEANEYYMILSQGGIPDLGTEGSDQAPV